MNGQMKSNNQAQFGIQGIMEIRVATVSASNRKICSLDVTVINKNYGIGREGRKHETEDMGCYWLLAITN